MELVSTPTTDNGLPLLSVNSILIAVIFAASLSVPGGIAESVTFILSEHMSSSPGR